MSEKVKPYRASRWGIVNHLGEVWTSETFATEEKAKSYLGSRASFFPRGDLSKHRVVPVRVTISEFKKP